MSTHPVPEGAPQWSYKNATTAPSPAAAMTPRAAILRAPLMTPPAPARSTPPVMITPPAAVRYHTTPPIAAGLVNRKLLYRKFWMTAAVIVTLKIITSTSNELLI